MKKATFIIENTMGIHARPAGEIVKLAAKFDSEIMLYGNGKEAKAKGLLMIMAMGIRKGQELVVTVDGSDEDEALKAFQVLISENFYED